MITYFSGGRLGDLFHVLYVIFAKWTETNEQAILYISDDTSLGGATFGNGTTIQAEHTYNALKPIIEAQPYIAEFHLHRVGEPIPASDHFVNLNSWRHIPHTNDWIHLLSAHYQVPEIHGTPWIYPIPVHEMNPEYPSLLKNKVVIHRSYITPHRCNPQFPWQEIIHHNDCIFASTDPAEYEHFAFKDKVPFLHLHDLSDMMASIYYCKAFVGNQSAPVALAWAMHKPLIAEINRIDARFYMSNDIPWYLSSDENNMLLWNALLATESEEI